MDFERKTLGEISINGKGEYGIAAPAVNYDPQKRTYLRITDISDDGTLNLSDRKSVDGENLEKYILKENDIVFARTGASTGRNYFYEKADGEFVFAGFLIKFSIDPRKVNPRFIKYYCLSKEYAGWIQSFSTGSTRGNINAQTLANMELWLPPRDYQNRAVEILSSIDKKIAENRAINHNLQQQLQALFDSWFKRFEPFSQSKYESELGLIPEGWDIKDIYSISSIIYGAPFSSKLFNEERKGTPIVRIRDLKNQNTSTYTTEIHPKGYLIKNGDIIVGMDGEFRPYIWGSGEAWLNQRVCVFENKRPKGKVFLFCSIKPLLNLIEQTEVATTVIHIGKQDFDAFRIVMPPIEILNAFDDITAPMYEQIVNNIMENHRLSALRDTLLPRLMSGEIDVSKVEI